MAQMQTISRDEVLQMAFRLADEYGESLTLTAFRRETGLSQWAIFDLFGNWKNLRVAVGLTPEAPRTKNRITKSRILELTRELAAEHGENLTEWLFLNKTGLSGRLIADRFGSWGALRQAVGLKRRARPTKQYSDEDILIDLYRVWRMQKTPPKYHQHRDRGGKISPSTIQIRFGGWKGAIAAYNAFCRRLEGWHDKLFNVHHPPCQQCPVPLKEYFEWVTSNSNESFRPSSSDA